jgi:hypothetical protein
MRYLQRNNVKRLKYFLSGLKNAFVSDTDEIKKDYPIYELGEKSRGIEEKFKAIDEKTRENINKHLYKYFT